MIIIRKLEKMAAWALGKIGEDKAITALEHAIDDHNIKVEMIDNEIVLLNDQLQVLEDQITVLENEKILQESNKINIQSEITDAVAEQDKIDTSIKSLKKALQDNEGIEEYAREAIQRLNYN